MVTYHIEYKKVIIAYRRWFVPVHDFRFCIIETVSNTFEAETQVTLIEKYADEEDALKKLELLIRYNAR